MGFPTIFPSLLMKKVVGTPTTPERSSAKSLLGIILVNRALVFSKIILASSICSLSSFPATSATRPIICTFSGNSLCHSPSSGISLIQGPQKVPQTFKTVKSFSAKMELSTDSNAKFSAVNSKLPSETEKFAAFWEDAPSSAFSVSFSVAFSLAFSVAAFPLLPQAASATLLRTAKARIKFFRFIISPFVENSESWQE